MPTAIPAITPVPSLELLLGSGTDVPVEVCDAAVPVPVGVYVIVWPGVNVTSETTAELCPEAAACVTVTTTAAVPDADGAVTVWTDAEGAVTVWTTVDALGVLTFVTVLAALEEALDAEPGLAAEFHFANVKAIGVPESPQLVDIVLYTELTSLGSF
jgi:hypothetical protein